MNPDGLSFRAPFESFGTRTGETESKTTIPPSPETDGLWLAAAT